MTSTWSPPDHPVARESGDQTPQAEVVWAGFQAEGSHTCVIETRKIQDITDQSLEGVKATGAKSAISKQVEVGGQRHFWQGGRRGDQTQ